MENLLSEVKKLKTRWEEQEKEFNKLFKEMKEWTGNNKE